MAKLIILRGLPASGKSTKAQELLIQYGNAVRVNKDLLRTMLHFDKFNGKNESMTMAAEIDVVKSMLALGRTVIVDDTNLNDDVLSIWKTLAKERGIKLEIIDIETSWKECLSRDVGRMKSVGAHVIMRMAMQYGKYEEPEKGLVIYDIDGTLADIQHRRHHVMGEKKNWPAFFENMDQDKPRQEIVDMARKDYKDGYGIVVVSGRGEEYRAVTESWLAQHLKIPYVALFMRPAKNSRVDTEIKLNIYNQCLKNYNVVKVVDDRPSVIRMWREQGLNVIDVGDGIEF